jgi:hypothetical protein
MTARRKKTDLLSSTIAFLKNSEESSKIESANATKLKTE